MPDGETRFTQTHTQASFIFNRIGPIADWAYLKNIDPELVKEITLISARAELAAAQTYAKAVEDVVKVMEKAKVARG